MLFLTVQQEDSSPDEVVAEKGQTEPYLLVGNNQVFLAVDTEIVYELPVEDSVLGLVGSFFVFDISYTKGCTNMFTALEMLLLDSTPLKPHLSVSFFLSTIKSSS